LVNEPIRSENTSSAAESVPSAFGRDDNNYAYPSAKGMSGFGVGSIICALCSFFCLLTAFVGIGLGIAGLVRSRKDVLSYIGIALSAGFLIYNIVTLVTLCSSGRLQDIMASMM